MTETGGVTAPQRWRRPVVAVMILAAVTLVGACTAPAPANPGHDMAGMSDMGDLGDMGAAPTGPAVAEADPAGTGLAGDMGGYSFVPQDVLAPDTYSFRVDGPNGRAVTRYQPYESKLLILYVIRSDLSGFHVLDPAMREDGTWTARVDPALAPGSYRAFVTFAAPDSSQGTPLRYTLSRPFTVAGPATADPLSPASTTATVDGFTVGWTGQPTAGASVRVGVTVARDGKPVEHVDRVLDGYVHLTAFRVGDLASARFLATGKDSTGLLTADAVFPGSGTWRLFARFQVDGQQHTAAFTVVVP